MTTETRRPLRVIQWSTGNAGKKALAGIIRHPELELVGVHAHSKDKVGRVRTKSLYLVRFVPLTGSLGKKKNGKD